MSESLLDPQRAAVAESGCLRVQPESGWYTPPKAKYAVWRPIANKYREGKMQRTLNRELKELEVVGREAIATCGERRPGGDPYSGHKEALRLKTAASHPASIRSSSRYQLGRV